MRSSNSRSLSVRWQLMALAAVAVVIVFSLGYEVAKQTVRGVAESRSREGHERVVGFVRAHGDAEDLEDLSTALDARLSRFDAGGKRASTGSDGAADAPASTLSEDEIQNARTAAPDAWSRETRGKLVSVLSTSGGFVRVETTIDRADATTARLRGLGIAGAIVAFILSALFIEGVIRRLSREIFDLRSAAVRMARGELEVGMDGGLPNATPELRDLAVALRRLAANLSTALNDLSAERDLFGSVLDGMREGVLVLDAEGKIALANPAFRQTLLLSSNVAGKLPVAVIESPHLVEVLEEAHGLRRQVAAEVTVGRLMPRTLAVHAAPVAATSGATLAVFVDVTELRRFETMRRDFVANVSHELRTPITVIRATAETLEQSKWGDAMANDFVSIIERNAERLQRLVDDLLDLSRMDSGKIRLDIQEVELESLLDAVVASHREKSRKRGIRFNVRVAAEASRVPADRGALEQVLSNLVENEAKYAAERTTVSITTSVEDQELVVTLSDRGPGIPEHHLPRLFERFYRVDAGRSRDLGGTGLGLAIVKHLTEALRGTIDVESEMGKGTTFRLALPLVRDPASEKDPTPTPLGPLI